MKSVLALLPVLTVILVAGGYHQHTVGVDRQRELAYQQSLAAYAGGDFVAAQAGFLALGDYRDADEQLAAVIAESQPVQDLMREAQTAYLARDFDGAISILTQLIVEAPGYEDAAEMLNSVRESYAGELMLNASLSKTSRDWVAVEQALTSALDLQPDSERLSEELSFVLNNHAPMVYTRDGVVMIGGPTGDDERALTADLEARWAAWSPDRSQIAFLVPTPKSSRFDSTIMLMDADGSNVRTVIDRVLPFAAAQWSPDGTRLAYPSVRHFDEGSFTGRISLNVFDLASDVETDLSGDNLNHTSTPTWSPDGQHIAFVSLRMDRRRGGGVELLDGDAWSVDLKTGQLTNLTRGQLENENWITWSPAGDRMLVLTNPGDWSDPKMMRLYLLDASGTGEPEQVATEWQISLPSWSPDGSRFAFVSGGTSIRIWTDGYEEWIDVKGQLASHVTWSPDGSRLFVPTSSPPNPSWLVSIDENFGTLEPVRLRADGLAGGNGIVMWAPSTPVLQTDFGVPVEHEESTG